MGNETHSRRVPDRLQRWRTRLRTTHTSKVAFVHINKTGGSSIEAALGLAFRHKTALELRSEMGERRWTSSYCFTVVRNPWDKVVSQYHHRKNTNHLAKSQVVPSFNRWVLLTYGEQDPAFYNNPKMFMPQTDWICDQQGTVLVDFIGRFETLERDFATVCAATGRTAQLPHLKRSPRSDFRPLYDDQTADVIAHWFAADTASFGYRFD